MSKQLEAENETFRILESIYGASRNIRFVFVTLIVAITTLLLRRACRFFEGELQEMVNIDLILASNVKYHFRFQMRTNNLPPELNFS